MPYTNPEILAAQEAYDAKPFAVRWCDSHFAGTFRFDTLDAAYEYIGEMWALIRRQVRTSSCRASMLRLSYLETPTGRTSLKYVLLADDVSSY